MIIDIVSENPYLFVNLLIISITIILLLVLTLSSSKEHFSEETTSEISIGEQYNQISIPIYSHHETLASKTNDLTNKKINFSCMIDGKKYFVANLLSDVCKNTTNITPDCEQATVVLMEEDSIKKDLNVYLKKLSMNEVTCLTNENIKNKDFCKQKNMYIHDFTLDLIEKSENNKYVVRGTAIPSLNGKNHPTIINQALYQIFDSNTICSGNYGYGMHNDENIYAYITIIQNKESDNLEKCLLQMTSHVVLKGLPGKPATKITDNGKPRTVTTYVALDKQNKCNLYQRIKLVTDPLDPDILHFNIHIVV